MKSNKWNLFICLLSGLIIISFIFFSTDMRELARSIHELRYRWIAAAVACMLLYWLFESLSLHIMILPMHKTQRFRDTFRVTLGGQYFNSITPFATGGQPFQAYYLTRQGLTLGVAINALLSRFIIYQSALVLSSILLLSLRLAYFQETVSDFTLLVLIGFAVSLLVMAALIALALFPRVTRRFSFAVIRLLAKMHIWKDPEEKMAYMDEELLKFRDCFREMLKNIPAVSVCFLCSILELLCFMAVPYAIYKAFSLEAFDPITIIAAQSFVMMVSNFIPIPGASVGAEGAFYLFFRQFFPDEHELGLALILWRVITFYFTIAVSAFFATGVKRRKPEDPQLEDAGTSQQ